MFYLKFTLHYTPKYRQVRVTIYNINISQYIAIHKCNNIHPKIQITVRGKKNQVFRVLVSVLNYIVLNNNAIEDHAKCYQ